MSRQLRKASLPGVYENSGIGVRIRSEWVYENPRNPHFRWAAEQLGVSVATVYRHPEQVPGAFKFGGSWRVSVPVFTREIHGREVEVEVSC
jgi:hypothetical protein